MASFGRTTTAAAVAVGAVVALAAGPAPAVAAPGRASQPVVASAPAAAPASARHRRAVDDVSISVDRHATRRATAVPTPSPSASAPNAAAAATPLGSDRVQTDPIATGGHTTVGVTWADPGAVVDVQLRFHQDGSWSDWTGLGDEAVAPDAHSAEDGRTLRGGTDAIWVGGADSVELSFPTAATLPSDIRLALVGDASSDDVNASTAPSAPSTPSATPTPTATPAPTAISSGRFGVPTAAETAAIEALAAAPLLAEPSTVAPPAIITRAQWGAAAPVCQPDVASTLMFAVVHHTADSNAYTTVAQAEAQIRNDQQYHQQARGWCDIGYNFLVDKWGNVYEGRANSGSEPVIGVHAGGFNTDSVGISMLGDYSSITPSAATRESVARVIAWRLSSYHRDPTSTIGYTTGGGENSRYAAGTWLALPVVIGHRDVAYTACPGEDGYAVLGAIKQRAHDLIGTEVVNPVMSSTSLAYGSGASIVGGVNGSVAWTLTVVDRRTGVELVRKSGTLGPSTGSTLVSWDGRTNAGVPLGTGPYALTLSTTDAATGAGLVPWSQNFSVTGSQNPPTVSPVPLTGNLRYVPVTPARLVDTRTTGASLGPASRMDVSVAGVAGVPADAKAVALNVTSVNSSGVTYLTLWPAGQTMPTASTLNSDGGRTTAGASVVGVGGQGKVSLYNSGGSTHVVVDVTGYFTDSPAVTGGFGTLAQPSRVLDTRTSGGAIAGGGHRTITFDAATGVPSDATAVVLDVVSEAAAPGYVSVVPSGTAPGQTSTVNHAPGRDVANRAVVPLSGHAVDVDVAGGAAQVVVDVVGWFGPSGTQLFTPVVPVRVFDTRAGTGQPLGAASARSFALSAANLPADAQVVALNLTATQSTAFATYLTAWGGGTRPGTSDLNVVPGLDIANLALVSPSAGAVQVYNNAGTVHVVGDVLGYFR